NFLESYHADVPSVLSLPESGVQASAYSGIHAFPKGATAGTFLHDLLEWALKQGPGKILADEDRLREQLTRRCESRGWGEHVEGLLIWLKDFLTRSFRIGKGHAQTDVVLSELMTLLPEMEFWFGINDARLPTLDRMVSRHFLPGKARALMTQGRLRGLLRGFIDLVFEHEGRYYVADYKSNWLGRSDDAYTPGAMRQSILEHRYDLQLALYLFALHRLLRCRQGERYDYDPHVGGALVFFMLGSGAPGRWLQVERTPRDVR